MSRWSARATTTYAQNPERFSIFQTRDIRNLHQQVQNTEYRNDYNFASLLLLWAPRTVQYPPSNDHSIHKRTVHQRTHNVSISTTAILDNDHHRGCSIRPHDRSEWYPPTDQSRQLLHVNTVVYGIYLCETATYSVERHHQPLYRSESTYIESP